MYATLLKATLAAVLISEGDKQIRKDSNDTGRDDATGKALKAIGSAVNSLDLDTVKPETFRNMASSFRAAADELDRSADKL